MDTSAFVASVLALLHSLIHSLKMFFSKLFFCALASSALARNSYNGTGKQSNIVFFLSDDQDFRLGSLDYMENVQKSIVSQGLILENHFATVALCCPSRTSLLRGQAAHNTNITHVQAPG